MKGLRAPGAVAALLAVAAFALAPEARADLRYPVVLLRPPVSDEVTADALARVQGELTAAGFEVSTLPRDLGVDVRTALETSGRELEPIATFAIVRDQATAEIWVCDRIAGKSVIQSVRLDAPAAAGEASGSVVLAIRAVELGALEIVRGFRAGRRIQLVATLGAGGYRARIAGTGDAGYVGHDSDNWSLLTVGGGGLIVMLVPHVALTAEVQALVTWPHTVVRLGGAEAGSTGWPSLLLSAGVLATL